MIDTSKLMPTIFSNVSGIQVIDYLPSGEAFNSVHFIERILPSIAVIPARDDAVRRKKVFVCCMDNSPIHQSKAIMDEMANIPVQLAPHRPYSPYLAPSDFVLFGCLKVKMIGQEFDSPEDLIAWNQATVETIPNRVLEYVFEKWIQQVQQYIDHKASYFSE
jgi:hypothetical protein